MLAIVALVAMTVCGNATLLSTLWTLGYKPMPYRDDAALVELRIDLADIQMQVPLAPRFYEAIRVDRNYAGAIAFTDPASAHRDGDGRHIQLQRINSDFATVLGVRPALGAGLGHTRIDDGSTPALVLSNAVWRRQFEADPDVIGRRVKLDGQSYEVVGVMPERFGFPSTDVEAWTPFQATAIEQEQDRGGAFGYVHVVARLAPGIDVAAAQAQLARQLRGDPAMAKLDPSGERIQPLVRVWRQHFLGNYWRTLVMLQLAGLLLLLVVASALANLGLDHALARQRELATRLAMGGSAMQMRGQLIQSLLPPVALGAALGLALVPAAIALLQARHLLPVGWPSPVALDGVALLAALALGAVLLFAAISLSLHRAVLTPALHHGQRTLPGALGRTRTVMLVAQISVSFGLLGGAGLLLLSANRLLTAEHGFDARGVLLTSVDLGTAPPNLMSPLRDALLALPGVSAVAISDMPPFAGAEFIAKARAPGQDTWLDVGSPSISEGYFSALGSPPRLGREFDASSGDDDVLIDQTLASRWFGDRDPIGQTVEIASDGTPRQVRVIGVTTPVKQQALDEPPRQPLLYQRMLDPGPSFFIVTRTAGSAALLQRPVQSEIERLAPGATIAFNQPLQQRIDATLQTRRALLEAVGLFAMVCVSVAALALYAVLNVAVRRRRAELALRVAIGAPARSLSTLVLGDGLRLLLMGLLPGWLLGQMLAALFANQLYRVEAHDPWTWTLSALALGAATLFACWLPALGAMRVEPAQALRA
jgi:predicted permease